jgi:hypothetical protein
MRRVSEIVCELIRACFEMCKEEHFKMDEFSLENPDFKRITQADFLTRKNNEIRHDSWNELNETLISIIREKKYDWEKIEEHDWAELKKYGWDEIKTRVL